MSWRILLATILGMLLFVACQQDREMGATGFIAGDFAYVARDRQVHVVEIKRPDRPRWVATIDVPGQVVKVEASGRFAYILHNASTEVTVGTSQEGGLQIVEIDNPKHPKVVGHLLALGHVRDVVVAGKIGYVASLGALHVIDLSEPATPLEIASISERVNSVAVTGDYLYSTWGSCSFRTGYCEGGLWVADVSDPAYPIEKGALQTDGHPSYDIAIQENTLYIGGKGVWLVALSDQLDLSPRSRFELLYEGFYQSLIDVAGNHAYLISDKGLRIVDVANPYQMSEAGLLAMTAFVTDFVVRGEYAYTVSNEGLHVIDVRDPGNPTVIGYYGGV